MTAESKGQAGGVLTPVASIEVVQCGPGMRRLDFADDSWWSKLAAGKYDLFTRPTPAAAADLPPEQKGQQWREHLIPQFLHILNSAKADPVMPRHKFWGAGEPDCPQELKAPNGELHTMRCKACGDGWRNSTDVCFAALSRPASAPMDAMRAALREIDPCAEEAYTDEQIARLVAASPAAAAGVPTGWKLVPLKVTEHMHIAACKVLMRAHGLDGTPQRMLDAMLASSPAAVPTKDDYVDCGECPLSSGCAYVCKDESPPCASPVAPRNDEDSSSAVSGAAISDEGKQ